MNILKNIASLAAAVPVAVCAILFVAPVGALAAEIRTGPSALVAPGETIDDDLFAAGGPSVTISGHVTGDAYAIGETVIVNGSIDGDLIAAAQQVIVDGTIGGNLRAAGASVTINGQVGRSVTSAAQHLNITSNGRVGGSVVAAAANIDAFGQVGRGMTVGGGELQLAGSVGGPVLAHLENLSVASTAHLSSSLNYQAKQEAALPSGSVTGVVNFTPAPQQAARPSPPLNGMFDLGDLIGLCGGFLVGALALILLPRATARAAELGRQQPWQTFGIGLLVLVCAPIAAVVIGVTLIGIPLALSILALYVVGIVLAWPMIGLIVGMQLTRLVRAERPLPVLGTLAVGLIAVYLVEHLPVIGGLVGFCALAFGLGMLVQSVRRVRQQPERSMPPTAAQPVLAT